MTSTPDLFLEARQIAAALWSPSNGTRRMRVLRIGEISVHIHDDLPVLDALQAALDEIRADMDAEEAADAGNELAAS